MFGVVTCLQYTDKQKQRKTITITYLGDKCFIDKILSIKGLSIFVSKSSHERYDNIIVCLHICSNLKTGLFENDFPIDDDWNIGIHIKRPKVL